MGDPHKITGLIRTEGKTRVYQMGDGSVETREGGTVSWRNNNPGNLKFEYANSADKTVHTARTKGVALTAAQGRYEGVVALDQWGNAVFETDAAGRAAKAQLLRHSHGGKTIPEMLKAYAVDDYTGKANTDAYAQSVYAVGDSQGVDLRSKKIKDLSPKEFEALLDGMKKVEGFQEGTVTRTQPRADTGPEALSPGQQRVHQMASQALTLQLGATHSPAQIDTLIRSAVAVAAENAGRGDVQGVFLSKDQQTIALKQAFGISEIGVQEALNCSLTDPVRKEVCSETLQPSLQAQPQAPQVAALSR
ncbi:MAG: hypothetical protein IV088_00610 [Hydrogenophaga sp.]|uniref:hypothetical protein n=1 Tax=Hydrogenophaga sp. TaxID=1904254 RepID=UPI0025C1E694|nr:hypothetical protein [Hydrogenophaga sp.]MBT9549321.1 hypothetical protein [Hydrogenophaga sp.]